MEQYGGLSRMVNRNDAAVPAVFISGRRVAADGLPTPLLVRERTGSFLRAEQAATMSASPTAPEAEAAS